MAEPPKDAGEQLEQRMGYLIAAARAMRPGLKVLLTSGYSEEFIKTSDNSPDVRLLNKPYRRETLAAAIRSALDGNLGVAGGS